MKHANLIATSVAILLGAVVVWFVYLQPKEEAEIAEVPKIEAAPVVEEEAEGAEPTPIPSPAPAVASDDVAVLPLKFRVEAKGFDASEQDIRKLLESGARELWQHFPGYKVEPIVVARSQNGPITIYNRNLRGEIIVKLDTRGTAWSQYSYQWAHELCHVLCGFRPQGMQNKWFEETLCELASIYVMRRMAESWQDDPPYANWADYRLSLKSYADDVIESREKVSREDLPAFYQKHKARLAEKDTDRELAGTVAVTLLPWFEEQPARWEAIRWLNADPEPDSRSFEEFLREWRRAVPERQKETVGGLIEMFGFTGA